MRNLLSKVTLNWTDVQSGKENRYAPVLEIFRCLASLQSIACLTTSLCRSLRMFHIYMTWNFVNLLSNHTATLQDAKRVDEFDVSLIISYDACPPDLVDNQKNVLTLKVQYECVSDRLFCLWSLNMQIYILLVSSNLSQILLLLQSDNVSHFWSK